jgi:hypothetical protein
VEDSPGTHPRSPKKKIIAAICNLDPQHPQIN